jgi:hypothetical protein
MTAEQEQFYNFKWGVAPYDTPEGRAAAPQWLIDKMVEEGYRPASRARGPVSTKQQAIRPPAQRFLSNWSPWGMGTLGLGIVLIIIAIVLHDHYALPNAVCRTSIGQLGQAFSGTAYTDCSTASTAESAVGPLVFFGVGGLLVGGGKMLLALVGAAMLAKEETASANGQDPGAGSPSPAAITPNGAVVTANPAYPTTEDPRLFCTRCGKRGAAGDQFCGGCGAAMSTATRTRPPLEDTPNKGVSS